MAEEFAGAGRVQGIPRPDRGYGDKTHAQLARGAHVVHAIPSQRIQGVVNRLALGVEHVGLQRDVNKRLHESEASAERSS